jgi:hypothetical protein
VASGWFCAPTGAGCRSATRWYPRGLAQRIAQRLLALTLGIFLNLHGRPARALAVNDSH